MKSSERLSTVFIDSNSKNAVTLSPLLDCLHRKRFPHTIWTRNYFASFVVSNREPTDSSNEDPNAKENAPKYQTIHASHLSEEEMDQIIAEEEAALQAEIDARSFPPNWRPGQRKLPLQVSYSLEDFEYELNPAKFNYQPRWTLRDKRCGVLAIKVGMMPVWDDWGERHACTVLLVDHNVVLRHKTKAKHGYTAVQVAAGQRKRKNVGISVLGQYQPVLGFVRPVDHDATTASGTPNEYNKDKSSCSSSSGLLDWIASTPPSAPVPYLVREFRIDSDDEQLLIPIGTQIHARHFVPGQNVDVTGITKGKGFQGAMKKHGFKGMPASHGVSKSHRALGSTGQCQDPGKVWKGKKMAGRMGSEQRTIQNLRVVKIDRGRNLIFVKGAIPGSKGTFCEIRDAVKKPLWKTSLVLDGIDRPPLPTYQFESGIDGCGAPGHDVFMPLPDRDPLVPDMED
jgi:large subunit ribosomal protein L3